MQVFEGERPFACDNHMLGMFQLPNIKRGPAGSANIMVTMRVGKDGVLHATAYDEDTGEEQHSLWERLFPSWSAAVQTSLLRWAQGVSLSRMLGC